MGKMRRISHKLKSKLTVHDGQWHSWYHLHLHSLIFMSLSGSLNGIAFCRRQFNSIEKKVFRLFSRHFCQALYDLSHLNLLLYYRWPFNPIDDCAADMQRWNFAISENILNKCSQFSVLHETHEFVKKMLMLFLNCLGWLDFVNVTLSSHIKIIVGSI